MCRYSLFFSRYVITIDQRYRRTDVMLVAQWHRAKSDSLFASASVTDWCMSLNGIARPQNQSSPNSGKKCPLARPLTMQNCVAIRQEVSDVSAIKNLFSPKKVGRNSPKSLKTCYPLKPSIMPNLIQIGETTLEKSVTKVFLPPTIFWLPRGTPGPKVTIWVVGYTNPPIAACKISSRSNDPSSIYLLPNFVDFVASVSCKKYGKR